MTEKYIEVEPVLAVVEAIGRGYEGDNNEIAAVVKYIASALKIAPSYTPTEILAGMWVPVTERLPEIGEVVIAYEGGNTWSVGQYRGSHTVFPNERSHWLWKHHTLKIVHWWMPKSAVPLPEPPKDDEEGDTHG